jgi:hypothetical protein
LRTPLLVLISVVDERSIAVIVRRHYNVSASRRDARSLPSIKRRRTGRGLWLRPVPPHRSVPGVTTRRGSTLLRSIECLPLILKTAAARCEAVHSEKISWCFFAASFARMMQRQ